MNEGSAQGAGLAEDAAAERAGADGSGGLDDHPSRSPTRRASGASGPLLFALRSQPVGRNRAPDRSYWLQTRVSDHEGAGERGTGPRETSLPSRDVTMRSATGSAARWRCQRLRGTTQTAPERSHWRSEAPRSGRISTSTSPRRMWSSSSWGCHEVHDADHALVVGIQDAHPRLGLALVELGRGRHHGQS